MPSQGRQRAFEPWEKSRWGWLWTVVKRLRRRGFLIPGPGFLDRIEPLWALRSEFIAQIEEKTIELLESGFRPGEMGKDRLWPMVHAWCCGDLQWRQGVVGRWFEFCKLVALQQPDQRQEFIEALRQTFQRLMVSMSRNS